MECQAEKKNNVSGSPHVSVTQRSEEPRYKEFEIQVFRRLSTLTLKIQQISEDIGSIRENSLEKNLDSAKVAEEEFIFQFLTE
ncbi:hypothetical protein JTB14_012673 [Gonioctena quinquepunctata]|nr:hypothetical protein JTB14_012673 [Gonioctena quinquepunctata]